MLTIEKKSLQTGRYVNTEHVNTVIRNYKRERWAYNSKRIGKEDSLSVWYSLVEIENFLKKAKEEGADGLRLYFGVYTEADAPKPLYADRQTVVFVATKNKSLESGSVNKDIYINTEAGTSILAYNVGAPCPPVCSDNGIGITIIDKGADGLIVS